MTDGLASADTALARARELLQAGQMTEAEHWSAQAVERHSDSPDLWNVRGVILRKLGRQPEALSALDRAVALKPDLVSARLNRGNVLVDLGDLDGAIAAYAELVAGAPDHPLFLHFLGSVLFKAGRHGEAASSLRRTVTAKPDDVDAWILLGQALARDGRPAEAEQVLEQGLAANPDAEPLMKAKAAHLRDSGQALMADIYLQDLVESLPKPGWALFHQADLVWESDRGRGDLLFRRALEAEPDNLDYLVGLIQSLERTQGLNEGADLDEAHELALRALALGPTRPAHTKVLRDALMRVAAFDELDRLGDFRTLGRSWAGAGLHTALLKQLGRVTSHADRMELVEQHRIWGRAAESLAAREPIRRSARRSGGKIRLGVVSSDLRRHVVSFFAQPVFDHIDRERFEVFAYSFARVAEDEVQAQIASQVDAFRWRPGIGAREAAQMIADDGLDVLIELGGSTSMNKLEIMAYKPAPLQASWLGYPHSTGLSTIDYFICDRHNLPSSPELLLERPLLLPQSWVTFGGVFTDDQEILGGLPEERNGTLTFGSANSPQKYTREGLRTWARVLGRLPGSRFAFVRPEAGSAAFRRNVLALFAAEGIAAERVLFNAVRGQHMAWYNQIDISLDTFPLTGGTTTAEALWMGVPIVSLVGETFYERISRSILTNAGLADLCAADVDDYVEKAVGLGADRERRRELRGSLRGRIRSSALGRTQDFARDFYDAIAAAVRDSRPD